MSNNGRVAWVTGGGTGIGQACVEMLAARGWSVAVTSRRAENVEAAIASAVAKGGDSSRLLAVPLDVSDAAAVETAANQIVQKFGRIDLLVNSAGVNVRARNWPDVTNEGWDQVIGINLDGLMYCMRAVLPAMKAQKEGTIVNVSSWAGKYVSPLTGPAYVASKHAVVALTESFNMENAKNNLRACCVCPGEVATPILKSRPVVPTSEEQARMLQADDVAGIIVYVAEAPQHVCVNEILISPTHNRGYIAHTGL
ncbi:MAG: SDR family oxidoreductase [Rhodoblastus sp.]|nr:SDR family oxidoreductase [Rhodoblastus sp.]